MNSMVEAFLPQALSSHSAMTLGMDVALKATLLLLLAFALDAGFGRRRALVRSTVLNACMVGLLLLPLITLVFPPLQIRCLPAPAATQTVPQEVLPDSAVTDLPTQFTAAPPAAPTCHVSAVLSWPLLLGTIYAAGTLLLLLRLTLSFLAILRLRRTAAPVTDAQWLQALRRWHRQLGIRRPVMLAVSREISVPTAIGWLHPVVLLPEATLASTEAADRDAILLHELAHVRRHDYAWQLLLRVVQVAYWPHPMVWVTGRLVAGAREQACDDVCVHHTASPETYRNALIRAAALLAYRPPVALGTAFARSSRIGQRLEDINAGCRNAHPLAPQTLRISVAVLALAGVVTLGPLELACREAKGSESLAVAAQGTQTPGPAEASGNGVTEKPAVKADESGSRVAPTPASQPNVALLPASSGPLPSVKVDEQSYDFGTVLGVESVKHTYTLQNVGEGELKIESVQPSCGCTTAGQWAKTVPPGAIWELPITLRTSAYNGPLKKQIVVKTNDPAHHDIIYVITGTARARFSITPMRNVVFKDLEKDSVASSKLTITNQTEDAVELTDAKVDSPSLRATLREITKGKVYELEITTVPPLTEGARVTSATIKTSSKDEPVITIPIMTMPKVVRPRLSLQPSAWPVPETVDHDLRLTFTLDNRGNSAVHVKAAQVSDPAIQPQVQTMVEGKTYSVSVNIPKGTSVPPEGFTVVVATDDTEFPMLTGRIGTVGPRVPVKPQPVDQKDLERVIQEYHKRLEAEPNNAQLRDYLDGLRTLSRTRNATGPS